jgi:hypothetical protein
MTRPTLWFPALLVAILFGCAGPQAQAPRDPAQRLKERVSEYWEARIRSDLVATYALHEPAFRRAVTLTAFLQGRGVTHVYDYEILEPKIDGDMATVPARIKWSITHRALVKPVEPRWADIEERWVRVDGEWYRKFRFPVGDPYPEIDWNEIAAERELAAPPPRPVRR